MMVGEVWRLLPEQTAAYYGRGDELHLNFNLLSMIAGWEAATWRDCLEETFAAFEPVAAWPTWVLSNHDSPRHRTRFGGCEARARAAAVMLLTLRGTPVMYMGEELGLLDAEVPPARVVDPGGRDGCRAPFPWDATPGHGWGAAPWLPWPPEPETRNAASLRADESSIPHLYRRVLAARRSSPALQCGELTLLPSHEEVLAFRREHRGKVRDARTVAVNFGARALAFDPGESLSVEVASDGRGEGESFRGRLEADRAVILR
jgi:alpha-glucosidase